MIRHLAIPVLAALATAWAADGHDHGPLLPLGTALIGQARVAAGGAGQPAPGRDWHVAVQLDPAAPAPRAVRLWVGAADGRGSAKARAGARRDLPGRHEAHVEIPAPLPAGSRLWIALEGADGAAASGSLPLPDPHAGHAHGPGDGHGH